MDKSPFSKANTSSAAPKGSSPCSQQPTICPHVEPHYDTPSPPVLFSWRSSSSSSSSTFPLSSVTS